VQLFDKIPGVTVFSEKSPELYSNHWLSCIVIDPSIAGFSSSSLRLELEKSNIESRPLWKPMHLQPVFESSPYYGARVSENLFTNGLCLPSGSNLTSDDKNRIKTAIENFCTNTSR